MDKPSLRIPDHKKRQDPVVACVQKPALRPRIETSDPHQAQKVDVLQVADPWARALPTRVRPSSVDFAGLNKVHDSQIQHQQKQISDLQQSMASLRGNVASLQKQSQKQEERTNQLHVAIQDTIAEGVGGPDERSHGSVGVPYWAHGPISWTGIPRLRYGRGCVVTLHGV